MARNRDASTSVVCGDSARAWWNEVVMHMYCVSFGAASFADAISDMVTCQIYYVLHVTLLHMAVTDIVSSYRRWLCCVTFHVDIIRLQGDTERHVDITDASILPYQCLTLW